MSATEHANDLERDLKHALDDLQGSLSRAGDALGRINDLLPRLQTIGAIFDDIDAVLQNAREQFGITGVQTFSRPTLVVPRPLARPFEEQTQDDAWTNLAETWKSGQPETQPEPSQTETETGDTSFASFRLEFESAGSPLDLRAVDDAVSEHPAVRDVALLDYDGRKATLKVWIDDTASPEDVRNALVEKSSQLFEGESAITITAVDDAAA